MTVTGKGFKTEVASTVPVDDSTLPYTASDVQEALEKSANNVAVSASPGFSLGRSGLRFTVCVSIFLLKIRYISGSIFRISFPNLLLQVS